MFSKSFHLLGTKKLTVSLKIGTAISEIIKQSFTSFVAQLVPESTNLS